jgi:HPt (histidine-containing phosphotransfer) domain-containing protein
LISKFPEIIEENEFKSLIENKQIDKAIEKTHLIKGVTANLSFDSLYVSYTEIVNLLRAGNPDAALNEFVKIEELQKNLVEYIKNNLN